jgi:hypothetical protein
MNLKCIGCNQLKREEGEWLGKHMVIYSCPKLPYATTIGGLIRPGKGIIEAAARCPVDISEHCIICGTGRSRLRAYGKELLYICAKCGESWSTWLSVEHPDRRQYLCPRNRLIHSRWIEVFREFIESTRSNT